MPWWDLNGLPENATLTDQPDADQENDGGMGFFVLVMHLLALVGLYLTEYLQERREEREAMAILEIYFIDYDALDRELRILTGRRCAEAA